MAKCISIACSDNQAPVIFTPPRHWATFRDVILWRNVEAQAWVCPRLCQVAEPVSWFPWWLEWSTAYVDQAVNMLGHVSMRKVMGCSSAPQGPRLSALSRMLTRPVLMLGCGTHLRGIPCSENVSPCMSIPGLVHVTLCLALCPSWWNYISS